MQKIIKRKFNKHWQRRLLATVFLFVLFLGICLIGAGPAKAQESLVPCDTSVNKAPCTLCHLVVGFENIYKKFFLPLLFIAVIFFIVVAGVIYMVSSGNKALMDWAKKALLYSLTAFILFLCSWLIVNVILTALDYNKGTWWKFECDETSAWGKDGDKKKCSGECKTSCSSGEDKGEGTCEEGKVCCVSKSKKTCQSAGGICRVWDPTMEGQKKCDDDEDPKEEYTCPDSKEVCCVRKGSCQCNPTNNGCGGLPVQGGGCEYTSSELASMLSCLKQKGVDATVISITLNQHADWCEKCICKYSGSAYCAHGENSCHWGGRNCKGTSQAADLKGSSFNAIIDGARNCGADYTLNEGTHVHASVNNSKCGCDIWQIVSFFH